MDEERAYLITIIFACLVGMAAGAFLIDAGMKKCEGSTHPDGRKWTHAECLAAFD